MDSNTKENASSRDAELLLVLRDIQSCMKRLERHLDVASTQGNNSTAVEDISTGDYLFKEGKLSPDTSPNGVVELGILENSIDLVPNVPKLERCLVTADSISGLGHAAAVSDQSGRPPKDIDTVPRDWRLLPANDSVVEWKYYKPLCEKCFPDRPLRHVQKLNKVVRRSNKESYWSTGFGKPSLNIDSIMNSELTCTSLFYVPYSLSTSKDCDIASYTWPWKHPSDPRLREKHSQLFGSFWAVPGDNRLELHLTFPSVRSKEDSDEKIMAKEPEGATVTEVADPEKGTTAKVAQQ